MHLPQTQATVVDSFYTTSEKVNKEGGENQESLKGQKLTRSSKEVK